MIRRDEICVRYMFPSFQLNVSPFSANRAFGSTWTRRGCTYEMRCSPRISGNIIRIIMRASVAHLKRVRWVHVNNYAKLVRRRFLNCKKKTRHAYCVCVCACLYACVGIAPTCIPSQQYSMKDWQCGQITSRDVRVCFLLLNEPGYGLLCVSYTHFITKCYRVC